MMMKLVLFLAAIGLSHVNTCNAAGDGDHGPWEYASLYHLTGPKIGTTSTTGDYTFLFYKQKDKYADATFDVSFSINSVEGAEGIEKAEPAAKTLWNAVNGTVVNANNYTTFLSKDTKYTLVFDDAHAVSSFRFKFDNIESPATAGKGTSCGEDCHFIFFFQHFPSEFDLHLFDANGKEIMPEATEPATPKPKFKAPVKYANYTENGGIAMFASIIVAFCTLLGILTVLPCCNVGPEKKNCMDGSHFFMVLASAFASGTLFSTTVMLILPEGVRMVDGAMGYKHEEQNNLIIGICLFSGFFLGALIDVFSHFMGPSAGKAAVVNAKEVEMQGKNTIEEGKGSSVAAPEEKGMFAITPSKWGRVVGTIIVGDFMHNFVDGIAIGVAFLGCNVSGGWIVAGSAILHEVPQEISDFLLLKLHGNMSNFEALLTNFLSGLSCIIGCAIALGAKPGGMGQGVILLIAAGQYFWIATVECFPKILKVETMKESFIHLGACCLGVLIISIVVLFHVHCIPEVVSGGEEAAAAAADGHAHGH